jgi:uncharacterized protein
MAFYHILALDGGGIRGVLTAVLLERLEKACPGFLSNVDLIAGTSTGGILGLGLAAGLSPQQIRELYENSGGKIFAHSFWNEVRDFDKLIAADYNNKPLREALLAAIGDVRLADLKKKVVISSFDLDNGDIKPGQMRTWKAKFFQNFPGPGSDGEEKLIDVALRTSAAPTFFPIYQGYVDGGVVANNPSLCALAQAINKPTGGQTISRVSVLSLGTGAYPSFLPETNSDWGLVQWAPHLISLMLDGDSGLADYQCSQILGSRYLRLNPAMPRPIGLDAVSEIDHLKEMAQGIDLTNAVKWINRYYFR